MGKGGKGKLKTYKPPAEKFVVIYKAWGVDKGNAKVTCNQIAAWFEVMLKEKYPDTRPYGIYYQPKKLHYFIVELPSNVDINPYLGTHRYDAFLKGIQTSPNDVACLYEYNYKSFGNPAKSWNQGFAEYAKIPEGFPVRSPYPMPGPAVPPPGDLPSAIYPPRMPTLRPQIPADLPPIPGPSSEVPASSIASSSRHPHTSDVPSVPQLVEPNHQKTPTPIRDSSPALEMHQEPAPAPETSAFQPYEPPAHYQKPLSRSPTPPADTPIPSSSDVTPGPSTKLQKWDPYEEEEAAEALLRASFTSNSEVTEDIKSMIKNEYNDEDDSLAEYDDDPIDDDPRSHEPQHQREADEGVLNFLQSAIPSFKAEPEEVLLPSAADDLSRSATLDSRIHGEEEEEDDDDDYVPSAELAAAFAAMAGTALINTSSPALPAKSEPTEPSIPRVKPEPQDVDMALLFSGVHNHASSSRAISRSPALDTEVSVPPSQTASNSRSATVKSEYVEARPVSLFSMPLVKSEPIEALLPPPPSGVKRPSVSESSPGTLRFKKFKRES